MNRHLHIICFDNPCPPDYGGAIDMYYKIVALYQKEIKIHLHYFEYGSRNDADALKKYCETIHVYKRQIGLSGFSLTVPYIVSSRTNKDLIDNLNRDNYPILAEGLHCTGLFKLMNTSDRKIVIRLHNDESGYYKQLASSTRNILNKIFFLNESRLLNKFQHHLPDEFKYACISDNDIVTYINKYHLSKAELIPAFIGWQEVKSLPGSGEFCLYHGNLSVPENERAATWLLKRVFSDVKIPFVIAGKNPTTRLKKLANQFPNVKVISNPDDTQLQLLIREAQIHVLPSFNRTGVKLKLLHALFEGRHCVTSNAMIEKTDLEAVCHIGSNAKGFKTLISKLFQLPFNELEINLRRKLLTDTYSNTANAEKLIPLIW